MRLCACKYMHRRVPDSYGFRVHLVYVLHMTRKNLAWKAMAMAATDSFVPSWSRLHRIDNPCAQISYSEGDRLPYHPNKEAHMRPTGNRASRIEDRRPP